MKNRVRLIDLQYIINDKNKNYAVIWKHKNGEIQKLDESIINMLERFKNNDFPYYEVLNLHSEFGVWEVFAVSVSDKNKTVYLNCVDDGANKQIQELIDYIELFKKENGDISNSLIDELICFSDQYEKDEEVSLSELLEDFEEEVSNWSE